MLGIEYWWFIHSVISVTETETKNEMIAVSKTGTQNETEKI
jgi:hypothetical protein